MPDQQPPAPQQPGRQPLAPPSAPHAPAAPPQASPGPQPRDVPQQQLPINHTPQPIYGKDGRLTRAGMVAAINAGGSVMVNGRHYSKVADLPTSAELAQTDDERAAARRQLEDQQQEIQRQLASLGPAPEPETGKPSGNGVRGK